MQKSRIASAALATGLMMMLAGGVAAQGMGPGMGHGFGAGFGPGFGPGFEMGFGPGPGPGMEALDADGDGAVTLEEIEAATAARMAEVDANGDGALSADEISAWIEAERLRRQTEHIQRMIDGRDRNGDGLLQVDELPMAETMLERMFNRVDADGDGRVTPEEIEALTEGRRGPRDGGRQGAGRP